MRTGWHPHPVVIWKKSTTGWHPHPVVIFFQMTTGWTVHPVVNFFSNDNQMEVSSGSHFQIKMITGWNSSGYHSQNRKRINFSIRTTGWVSSGYHFDLEIRTGWHPHLVVIWKKINNRMNRPSGCHLNKNNNRMGMSSGCRFFSNDNRMRVSSGSHIRIIAEWIFLLGCRKNLIRV